MIKITLRILCSLLTGGNREANVWTEVRGLGEEEFADKLSIISEGIRTFRRAPTASDM